MDMLDLALKYNDIEWAKEIYRIEDSGFEGASEDNEYRSALDSLKRPSEISGLFIEKAAALENVLMQYAVKEKDGIRNFNINSEFDRNEADLVLVENPPYAPGDTIRYYIPTQLELIQMRGLVNGYVMGYRDAFYEVNRSYSMLFKLDEDKKRGVGSRKKRPKKNPVNEKKDSTKDE